jgi:hypothetical protein
VLGKEGEFDPARGAPVAWPGRHPHSGRVVARDAEPGPTATAT